MATSMFCCGFECGVVNAHWSLAGTGSFDTTTIRTGLRSIRVNPAGGQSYFATVAITSGSVFVARFYIRFATLPSNDVDLACIPTSPRAGLGFKSSDSSLRPMTATLGVVTFGSSGTVITTGVWYRIDLKVNVSANPWTIDLQVNGVAATQLTSATAATSATQVMCGNFEQSGTTMDTFYDDFLLSQTAGDYPLGAGHGFSSIPNADGTHNVAGANDFERSLTGTDITNATTDAWQLVDDRPLPSTEVDFINGVAPPNSTDYVEIAYEDATGETAAPTGVDHVFVCHDAGGAGTNNYTITLRDNDGGTSANTFSGTQNVGASITYRRAHYATIPGGGAWTLSAFNALRTRFLVSDASPDPYIDALMLEADFPDPAGGDGTDMPWPQTEMQASPPIPMIAI